MEEDQQVYPSMPRHVAGFEKLRSGGQ